MMRGYGYGWGNMMGGGWWWGVLAAIFWLMVDRGDHRC